MPSLHLFQYVSEVGPWLSADKGMVLVIKIAQLQQGLHILSPLTWHYLETIGWKDQCLRRTRCADVLVQRKLQEYYLHINVGC
jgi:hypothetical protein